MDFKGYHWKTYEEVQGLLKKAKDDSEKTDVDIAAEIKVQSVTTVRNAFATEQGVSDEVLTKIFKSVGISGFVLWENGERNYFIKPNGKK